MAGRQQRGPGAALRRGRGRCRAAAGEAGLAAAQHRRQQRVLRLRRHRGLGCRPGVAVPCGPRQTGDINDCQPAMYTDSLSLGLWNFILTEAVTEPMGGEQCSCVVASMPGLPRHTWGRCKHLLQPRLGARIRLGLVLACGGECVDHWSAPRAQRRAGACVEHAMCHIHTLLVLLLLLPLLVWLRLGFVARRLGAVPVLLLAQILPILASIVLDEVACAAWRRRTSQQVQTRVQPRRATEV